MEEIKNHFKKKFETTGIALTVKQCLSYAKEKKLSVTKKQVSEFVTKELEVAKFSPVKRPKHFQTIGVLRAGIYFIDYADFHKNLSVTNNNCSGFLVAVENITNRLFVEPCSDKGTQKWLSAVRNFIEITRNVTTMYSDRDSVATSQNFRDEIMQKYGLQWHFLKKGSKSYLAERYIRFVKEKLSQAMMKKNTNKWIQFVPALVKEYNSEIIEGTRYRRQAVTSKNFNHFLQQLFRTDDADLMFNSSKAGPFAQESWNKKIFKYHLGQKVLLSQKANWKNPSKIFDKPSVKGGFTTKSYTISGRQLRKTKGLKDYIAVYSLKEMGHSLHFYESELKSVSTKE